MLFFLADQTCCIISYKVQCIPSLMFLSGWPASIIWSQPATGLSKLACYSGTKHARICTGFIILHVVWIRMCTSYTACNVVHLHCVHGMVKDSQRYELWAWPELVRTRKQNFFVVTEHMCMYTGCHSCAQWGFAHFLSIISAVYMHNLYIDLLLSEIVKYSWLMSSLYITPQKHIQFYSFVCKDQSKSKYFAPQQLARSQGQGILWQV